MEPDELKKHQAVMSVYRHYCSGLTKQGREYKATCPLPGHKDDTPSFTVYLYEGVWIFKCHGCQATGNAMQFVQRMENCGFTQACEIVKKSLGVDADEIFHPKEVSGQTYTLAEYKKYEDQLTANLFVQNWLLHERGIGIDAARKLHFGYTQSLSGKRISEEGIGDIIDKGWISLPVVDGQNIVAIEFRSIMRKEVRKMPEMKTACLLGAHLVDPFEPVFVVEGGYDAAVLVQAGFVACSIPGAGYTPSPEGLDALKQAEYTILAGDMDVPGLKAMKKLYTALQNNVYGLVWPDGAKDANQVFLEPCKRDQTTFKTLVDKLVQAARLKPMPGLYSVQTSLKTAAHTKLIDHPDRLRFPWKSIDDMAIILPGTVTTVFSTDSGQGKTTWVFQATIHAAREQKQVVLNYQAELTPHQIDTIFTSHVLRKDRLNLEEVDYRSAGLTLGDDFQYYIGRDPSLTSINEVLDLMESGIKRFSPDIVVLDNLHFLCRGTGNDVYKEQATAMQRITNMAATYNLKFIVVHQARKADQQHKGKTRHVSDIDGTKAIQNDSTTIFSLHRDEVTHKGDEIDENEYSPITEIAVKKFRDKGPGGSFAKLVFAGRVCSFGEMAPQSFKETPQEETMF
jgi:hypothetical protein